MEDQVPSKTVIRHEFEHVAQGAEDQSARNATKEATVIAGADAVAHTDALDILEKQDFIT